MKFSLWVVESKQTGDFLGEVGFFEHRRDIEPAYEGTPEAGWVFVPEAHGQGLATETMMAALAWADQNLQCDKTVSLFDPQHNASIRVAGKLGYDTMIQATFQGKPAVIMERKRKSNSGRH